MKRTTTEEFCRLLAAIAVGVTTVTAADKAGVVTAQSQGLHGYIGFSHDQPPAGSGYSAGMGFYAAVWPLIDQPLADFQIGLPSSWVTPNNSDNKDQPLAPEGTLARTWMALPFTDPTTDDPPTGDQSWTCFLSAANYKGPMAYYI
ncbi:MAG: hypothetical protein KJ072_24795, partial [Verrucomicrobia bacterium]|nr:hypothetical protein [Verrucomicrobiota bacterium]